MDKQVVGATTISSFSSVDVFYDKLSVYNV